MRRVLVGAVGVLLAFHVWIFGGQVLSGDLGPGRVARWFLAGVVAAAMGAAWRQGGALRGRRAVALWALAALLHGPVLVERFEEGTAFDPGSPLVVFQTLPVLLGIALVAATARTARTPRARTVLRCATRERFDAFELAFFAPEAPRPPPGKQSLFVS